MIASRSREPIWRGVHSTRGLLLDPAVIGEQRARARVLEWWSPGTRLHECGPRWLLVWTQDRWLDSHRSPGALLRLEKGRLHGTPCPSEPGATSDVTYTWQGRIEQQSLDSTLALDPAEWLDVGILKFVEPEEVRVVLATIEIVAPPLHPDTIRPRGIGDSSDARHQRESLESRPPRPDQSRRSSTRDSWDDVVDSIDQTTEPSETDMAFLRALVDSHERYLQGILELFDHGDLDEALRHAIPIGGEQSDRLALTLSAPPPRAELRITTPRPAKSALIGQQNLIQLLTDRYERAQRQLILARRIREAAFVLAELLQRSEEAVSLLEQRHLLREAAEVAELRELPVGLVIRQWWLAGDVERAIAIARRTGAFGDAIVRLEASAPERAAELRIAWANLLASAGDYATAVDVIWPLHDARPVAREWLRKAIELGGEAGARMLVRYTIEMDGDDPASADNHEHAREILADKTVERAPERLALVEELMRVAGRGNTLPALLQPLAIQGCHAMLRDWHSGAGGRSRQDCEKLARLGDDVVLREDLPSFDPAASRRTLHELTLRPSDAGTMAVLDVVPAPRGRLWVALGEAGVRLLSRDGRTLRHFDVPATHLVRSDSGVKLLAVARRDEHLLVSRIDLEEQRAAVWANLEAYAFADSFDGGLWFTSQRKGGVHALDTLGPRARSLWNLQEIPLVTSIHRVATDLHLVTLEASVWNYALPGLTLRGTLDVGPLQGVSFADPYDRLVIAPIRAATDLCAWTLIAGNESKLLLRTVSGAIFMASLRAKHLAQQLIVTPSYVVVVGLPYSTFSDVTIFVFHTSELQRRLELTLASVTDAHARLVDDTLYVTDELGRILVYDLARGELRAQLRS